MSLNNTRNNLDRHHDDAHELIKFEKCIGRHDEQREAAHDRKTLEVEKMKTSYIQLVRRRCGIRAHHP
jgi:hypothetical protein